MTDLIQIPRPTDADSLRRCCWANAVSIIGMEARHPEHRETWLELLGPVSTYWDLDSPFSLRNRTGLSTCGLVAEGIWRRMGVDLGALYEPYRWGQAIGRARVYAQQCGAWRTPADGGLPQTGDYVVIGSGLATHALTALEWDGAELVSVDGGQVDPVRGLQAIYERRRTWTAGPRGARLGARSVLGWCDVTRLGYRGGTCLVPDGWED